MRKAGNSHFLVKFSHGASVPRLGALLVMASVVCGVVITPHVVDAGEPVQCSNTLGFDGCKLKPRFRRNPSKTDKLTVSCKVLNASAAVAGIDPSIERTLFTLDDSGGACFTTTTEPADCVEKNGSFKCKPAKGTVPFVQVKMKPDRRNPGSYKLKYKAKDADMQCLEVIESPWTMGLEIGDDCGQVACPSTGRRIECFCSASRSSGCVSPTTTTTTTTVPICGDGVVNGGDQCDDGNLEQDDACLNDCTLASCGDGIVWLGIEECDDGANNSDVDPDACRSHCVLPGCGDGVVDSGEECDDDNTDDLDGCDSSCQNECGNGNVDNPVLEQCDDGNTVSSVACLNDCTLASCGDGIACTDAACTTGPGGGPEECDLATDCCQGCSIVATGCQHPLCPDSAGIAVWAGVGATCAIDNDCGAGTCDLTLGRCRTVTSLNYGTSGAAHDADVNDRAHNGVRILCEGPIDMLLEEVGGCGECELVGIDPSEGACRCENDRRIICDEPFQSDNDDCGGNTCQCFLAAPLPLSSSGVAVCVVLRLAENLTGTGDVDTAEFEITANLRTEVYLGLNLFSPCPTCDGDVTYNDGVRDGTCSGGQSLGQSCDSATKNHSFPFVKYSCSLTGDACEGDSDCSNGADSCDATVLATPGGEYSMDCMPSGFANLSGLGLPISLELSSGNASLTAGLSCAGPFQAFDCHCMQCSGDTTVPCSSDAECSAVDAGTCSSLGVGDSGLSNSCADGVCTPNVAPADTTMGYCAAGPAVTECDGILLASGEGFLACASNTDCSISGGGVVDAGSCTLSKARWCFLDTVQADGSAIPGSPVGGSVFCIPPSGSQSVNHSAGLPGPGRVLLQLEPVLFCANDPTQIYTPGDSTSCQ